MQSLCSSTLSNIEDRCGESYTVIETGVSLGVQKTNKGKCSVYEPFKPPDFTGAACWHCFHTFTTIPCSIPMDTHVVGDVEDPQAVLGIFCSWSCACTWVLERKMHTTSDILMHINVAAANQGVHLPIARAPPAYCLRTLGGVMTIEEFRKIGEKSIPIRVLSEPQISFPIAIEGWKNEHADTTPPESQAGRAPAKPSKLETRGLYHDYCEKNAGAKKEEAPSKRRKQPKTVNTGPLASFIRQPEPSVSTPDHECDGEIAQPMEL